MGFDNGDLDCGSVRLVGYTGWVGQFFDSVEVGDLGMVRVCCVGNRECFY